jgi:hypothetical protein
VTIRQVPWKKVMSTQFKQRASGMGSGRVRVTK